MHFFQQVWQVLATNEMMQLSYSWVSRIFIRSRCEFETVMTLDNVSAAMFSIPGL